jgi:hypothetical protein
MTDQLFRELRQMDEALSRVSFGDFTALETLLPQRAALLSRIVSVACTPDHEKALRRSRHAIEAVIRQVCLARNLIVQETAQLTQEQRWKDSISGQMPEHSSNWSLQA